MAGWGVMCLLLLGSMLGVSVGSRLICWQAMMQCQGEHECRYAYSQYIEACSSVLPRQGEAVSLSRGSSRRRCPSHCIAALVQLNHTRSGPALEDCDCAMDEVCSATKRAIEPCMPRTTSSSMDGGGAGGGTAAGGVGVGGGGSSAGGGAVMGCMEARRLCQDDRRCSTSLNRYLRHCGRLFNGVRCTEECKEVIEDMMLMPKALLLNDCVCDGHERPICESIKENMARLCFGADGSLGGPGSSGGSEDDYDDYEEEEHGGNTGDGSYDEDHEGKQIVPDYPDNGALTSVAGPWTLLTSIVLMLICL
ncbi:growth arrest-specific protein 1 [Spea bombifrons]|uniref:growth arrest-specific protein 1 n=1 Tax=Spea bombifrons TaxID=233779 RepID=UPI00234A98F0|nr:growth arrest-specific protein 1 [Spea bombifrons]